MDDDEPLSSSPRARVAAMVLIAVFVGPTVIGMVVGLGLNVLVVPVVVLATIAGLLMGVRAYLLRDTRSDWSDRPSDW